MKKHDGLNHVCRLFVILLAGATLSLRGAEAVSEPVLNNNSTGSPPFISSETSIWEAGVGEGFRRGTHTLGISTGAGFGVAVFGGRLEHDLALMSVDYGCMIGGVKGESHWYRGNWEIRGELFGGAEFAPGKEWVVGLTPHLRYNFATGTRWIPFLDGGAGVTATGIGPPDLSNTFEFNLQASTGVQWFVKNNCAVTLEARWLHLSSAGISTPNLGLNTAMGMVGLIWFF